MNSFIRFDNFLLDRVFSPISEWVFANFGISNFRLARYLCLLAILFNFYDIYYYISTDRFSTALIDLFVLTILSRILFVIRKEISTPPGTVSPYRFQYYLRFLTFAFNIIVSLFFIGTIFSTIAMSNLLLMIYYFMSCDTPKGDRFRAFSTSV